MFLLYNLRFSFKLSEILISCVLNRLSEPFRKSALVQREKTQNAGESLKRELMKSKELALCALLHVIVMVHDTPRLVLCV